MEKILATDVDEGLGAQPRKKIKLIFQSCAFYLFKPLLFRM